MISTKDQKKIIEIAEGFWNEEVDSPEFRGIFAGKEIGHRIADYVDEKTTGLLATKIEAGFLRSKKGKKLDRSMGDIWIKSQGIYNPLNVKAGKYSEKGGQPNLVSLNKVLSALLKAQIDSYYLLIIKMQVQDIVPPTDVAGVTPKVYLVDMLDHLDSVHFNSGPGQLMLKEKHFYEKMNGAFHINTLDLNQKINELLRVKQAGDEKLYKDRQRKSKELLLLKTKYEQLTEKTLNQKDLLIG